ncbi:MAG TPA: acyl-CoA dehydrogenase family protein [Actinomycetota bacterium]|nr:acyl-CoA dehydrogenase family protein [Actinomycetota bacterium]
MIDFELPEEIKEVQSKVAAFVRDVVLPLEAEAMSGDEADFERVLEKLREQARAAGLWTPHLPAKWGGLGLGPLGMAIVSQECGASGLASLALNAMAPDEGNMHLLLHAATPEQLVKYLRPLADGSVRSCFAMTEKAGGSDPTALRTSAVKDGDSWVLNGEKWFISGAMGAAFAIVVAKTDPEGEPRRSYSLFLVDADNPGWKVLREIPVMGTHMPGGHCEVVIENCRVGADALLGELGDGYKLAQERLGPARLAHAMRWIGVAQRALDLAASRSLERETFGKPLARRQTVQNWLADSAIDLYASRLMVLHAAYLIENKKGFRQEVAMAKVFISEALERVVDRALQLHGSLGYSGDLPLERFYRDARAARIYDGPSEVHRVYIARNVLRAAMSDGSTKPATGGLA